MKENVAKDGSYIYKKPSTSKPIQNTEKAKPKDVLRDIEAEVKGVNLSIDPNKPQWERIKPDKDGYHVLKPYKGKEKAAKKAKNEVKKEPETPKEAKKDIKKE